MGLKSRKGSVEVHQSKNPSQFRGKARKQQNETSSTKTDSNCPPMPMQRLGYKGRLQLLSLLRKRYWRNRSEVAQLMKENMGFDTIGRLSNCRIEELWKLAHTFGVLQEAINLTSLYGAEAPQQKVPPDEGHLATSTANIQKEVNSHPAASLPDGSLCVQLGGGTPELFIEQDFRSSIELDSSLSATSNPASEFSSTSHIESKHAETRHLCDKVGEAFRSIGQDSCDDSPFNQEPGSSNPQRGHEMQKQATESIQTSGIVYRNDVSETAILPNGPNRGPEWLTNSDPFPETLVSDFFDIYVDSAITYPLPNSTGPNFDLTPSVPAYWLQ